jgi:hypothetical protein
MTTLIFRNASTESINSMSGETGELFVDTTKKTVVVALDGQSGGVAIGSEEYALNNLLPSKENQTSKYLYLNGTSAEWHKLNIVRPGTTVKSITNLQEPEFLKFDGSHKNKVDYPDLSSVLEPEYGLFDTLVLSKSNFLNANSQPISYTNVGGQLDVELAVNPPIPSSNYNNMVFDGTHYVRILGVQDSNYAASGNILSFQYDDVNTGNVFYPLYQPPYPPLGTPFKVQYSVDGIIWNTVTVAPFSNNATRCASVCTDGVGGIYMIAQNLGNKQQSNPPNDVVVKSTDHGVTWNQLLPISYNDGRIITCNPITKHLHILPGSSITLDTYFNDGDWIYGGAYGDGSIKKSVNNGVSWTDVEYVNASYPQPAIQSPTKFTNPLYTADGLMVCLAISYLPAFISNAAGDHWNKVKYSVLCEVRTDPNNNPQLTKFDFNEYTYREGNPMFVIIPQLTSQKTAPKTAENYNGQTWLNNRNYQFEPYITYNPADGYFYSAQTFSSSGIYGLEIEDPGFGYNGETSELLFSEHGYDSFYDFYVRATGYVTIEDYQISSAVITNPGYGYKTPPTAWLQNLPSTQFLDENNPSSPTYPIQAKINVLYDQSKERGTIVIKRHIATNALNELSYNVPKAAPNNNIEELFEVPATPWEDYAVFDNQMMFDPTKDELGLDSSDYRFGLGLHRLHISPIFGFMILTKNKILYNIDPVNNPDGWTKVAGLDETKMYNFSTCINVNDGVIISAENEVIKLYKSTTKFALNIIPPETVSGLTINTYLKA